MATENREEGDLEMKGGDVKKMVWMKRVLRQGRNRRMGVSLSEKREEESFRPEQLSGWDGFNNEG
jgi:hypothetical protein